MNEIALEVVEMFVSLDAEDKRIAAEQIAQLLGEEHPLAKQMRKMSE